MTAKWLAFGLIWWVTAPRSWWMTTKGRKLEVSVLGGVLKSTSSSKTLWNQVKSHQWSKRGMIQWSKKNEKNVFLYSQTSSSIHITWVACSGGPSLSPACWTGSSGSQWPCSAAGRRPGSLWNSFWRESKRSGNDRDERRAWRPVRWGLTSAVAFSRWVCIWKNSEATDQNCIFDMIFCKYLDIFKAMGAGEGPLSSDSPATFLIYILLRFLSTFNFQTKEI